MLSIFLIGIALSMDAFSLAISIGTTKILSGQKITFAVLVALMHFIMPQLGVILSSPILEILEINIDIFMIIIFWYLGISMLLKGPETNRLSDYKLINYIIMAFCVSIDSFSVGLGLESINGNPALSAVVFAFCSGNLTYLGLIVGEYSAKLLKAKATLFGAGILFLLAIVNMIEHFS